MKHSARAIQVAAIFLLTICLTVGQAQSNSNIVESSRAQTLVPFSQVSKDDFVIDVSQGNTEYLDGAISIPYTNFLKDKKLRSNEEISRILRDAGVPCDRPIYIYGKCAPCGGGSAPGEYIYLILKSFGYQVRLLDGSLEQWAASGGRTTRTPSIKPKTNCTPAVKSDVAERGNNTRIASGNGSKTEEGFEGTVTPQISDLNGNSSEAVSYTFEANITEKNLSDEDYPYPEDTAIRLSDPTKYPLYPPLGSIEKFYYRWNKILRESASSGKQLTDKQIERMKSDWDHAQRGEDSNIDSKAEFYRRFNSLLRESASSGKPLTEEQIKRLKEIWNNVHMTEESPKINTPNFIIGTRG